MNKVVSLKVSSKTRQLKALEQSLAVRLKNLRKEYLQIREDLFNLKLEYEANRAAAKEYKNSKNHESEISSIGNSLRSAKSKRTSARG